MLDSLRLGGDNLQNLQEIYEPPGFRSPKHTSYFALTSFTFANAFPEARSFAHPTFPNPTKQRHGTPKNKRHVQTATCGAAHFQGTHGTATLRNEITQDTPHQPSASHFPRTHETTSVHSGNTQRFHPPSFPYHTFLEPAGPHHCPTQIRSVSN